MIPNGVVGRRVKDLFWLPFQFSEILFLKRYTVQRVVIVKTCMKIIGVGNKKFEKGIVL